MQQMVWFTMVQWTEIEKQYRWFSFIDADTWIDTDRVIEMLSFYDSDQALAVGRLHRAATRLGSMQVFLGGGAGIFVSRGAVKALRDSWSKCVANIEDASWQAREHRGGDAWFGLCLQTAGIAQLDDAWLQGFPANTLPPALRRAAVTFHRGTSLHHTTHGETRHERDANAIPCYPYYLQVRRAWVCAPHFAILGAPKTGTTSLYNYLGQHGKIVLAEEKEVRNRCARTGSLAAVRAT